MSKIPIPSEWPETVVPVQSIADSGIRRIPDRYIKHTSDRTSDIQRDDDAADNIPVIDLGGLCCCDDRERAEILARVRDACRDWGFFQVVNHGVSHGVIDRAREVWREFFHLPMEIKQAYANSPRTYEGYGSRLGVEKDTILDWSDYYFLHYLPTSIRDYEKWPSLPTSCRDVNDEYGKQVVALAEKIMKILSTNLGLKEEFIQKAFGGDTMGACLRVNFYPKRPQPELTLGLSSHSDPGGMTLLLPDSNVPGLQVRRGRDKELITVKPAPHAFIINVGDQIQVVSNTIYKRVEHRVTVNSTEERISLAFFYNPKSDIPICLAKELVTLEMPSLYLPMTFDEYRLFIRLRGPKGKSQVESLKVSPR